MDKIIDVFPRITDLTYLKWSQVRSSSGTAGSFLKAYDDSGKLKKYYKLSDFDSVYGIIGHECINEIIAQRILRLLCIDHLEYRLLHANINIENAVFETWLCESDSFHIVGRVLGKVPHEAYPTKEEQAMLDEIEYEALRR